MRAAILPFFIALMSWGGSTIAAPTGVEEHCDIGAANLRDMPTPTAEACRDACDSDTTCAAFTHISGWNRCFLKKASRPKTTIKMYSGSIHLEAGTRTVAEEGYELDHSGKDWKKLDINKPAECKEKCLNAPECLAFTLIEGYRACWLKKTTGKLKGKVFRCGIKKA